MNLQIGSNIGDYQVVGILGAGGMGKVYKVRNVISDRVEAMKVLLPDLANEPELADRFLREIKTQASMEHPNIAALHTAVRLDNQLLMLMEFVEGVTLEQKLKNGPLPVNEAVDYIRQVLSALDYAHQRGVIHRDIKPANMIVTPGGVVKLMDFGIAKATTDHRLTQTGTTLGSLYYMSPEQIQGAATLDGRADLYSVGVSLYELVTGKRPFDGDSQFAIMSAHLEKTPVPPVSLDPKLPALLNDIILMSVSKDPNERFQTAAAFRNGLGNVVGAAPSAAPQQAAAAAAPAAAPVAAFAAPAGAPQSSAAPARPVASAPRSKRGLWMALGAVATAAVVIAVIQLAPWKKTSAAPEPEPSVTAPAASIPAAEPVAAEPAPAQPAPTQIPAAVSALPVQQSAPKQAAQVARPAAGVPQQPVQKGRPAMQQQAAPSSPVPVQQAAPPPQAPPQQQQQSAAPQQSRPAAPAGPSRAELMAAREQYMMLGTRAGTIRNSLATMQRSQAGGGLNLRGDMQEASSMMASYLEGANSALSAGDLTSAKSYMEKAERQIEKLEKFLGR